jgi:hypothetical protein
VPAHHGLGADEDQVILPAWPDSGEDDPEGAIERRESWPRPILGLHRELLSESQLDDCRFLATPKEGMDAAKDRSQKDEQHPHRSRMVRDRRDQNESESRNCRVYHPWMDVKGQAEKLSKINADEY